jgi:hypothetical protein
MATAPRNIQPVLDYEREEAAILQAAARPSIGLTVEESGSLEELGYLVEAHGRDYFDVVHLTGHGTFENDEPKFITETDTGDANYATAKDIARELKSLPPLLFVSGCHTGQQSDSVPSMAEQLLRCGAKAVLGWGREVLDSDAITAAAILYEGLSTGNSLVSAIAATYQNLIERKLRDWHLLRLYVGQTLPGPLVKPSRTKGWQRAERASMATEFLDPLTKKIKVPTRESFVGRRRQLQSCLRALAPYSETLGVVIHGMGGLGKSSLAARLCDRSPQFERVVWSGALDQANFVKTLAETLDEQALRDRLQSNSEA